MNKVYLLLGSNMGDSTHQLTTARKHIAKKLGLITRQSSLYETAAWGRTDQPDFINQVVVVLCESNAMNLIKVVLEIELGMGRVRTKKNAPRIIDIDVLYFNKAIINSEFLIVPHPAIQDRRFVLTPLNELSPHFIHPVFGKSNHALLLDCQDHLNVKRI